MRPSLILILLVAPVAVWIGVSSGAQSLASSAPLTFTFVAVPGTNTLLVARDAVRAWRSAGHPNAPATIQLLRGDYWLTETLALDGQDGNVAWVARDPAHTVISGGQCIMRFTNDVAGIWHATTGLRFEQLYVNGRRAIRARSPAAGFFNIAGVKQIELPDGNARIIIKVPAAAIATLPTDAAALHQVQILVFHKWDTTRYLVSSFDAAADTITVEGKQMEPWNPWNDQSRFILENSRVMLTQPGSWFLDQSGDLSYLALAGEQINIPEFVAPAIEQFISINGAEGIHFKGLNFRNAGWQLPASGCPPGQAAAEIGAAIEIDSARNVAFVDDEIAHTGGYGIWFRRGCRDCLIQHCLLEDLGAGGIRVGEMQIPDDDANLTESIVVDNNIIRGCGRVHPSAVGIWIGQSANNRITHNDISDTFYTGVSVGWTWGYGRSLATNNFVGFNRIHQIGQGVLSDMGGIYTLGVSPGSIQLGNVIFDVRAHDYGGWGIYPDEGSTGWQIESNLVWNCTCVSPQTGGAFHQHYGATNYIANNIFAFSSGPPMQATRVEEHLSFTLEHNLVASSNAEFFIGPWDKIHFESRSNCFVHLGPPATPFPDGNLASWQKAGHETGSILTNLEFSGNWPDVTLSRQSPALEVGFKMLSPREAGVYGDRAWKKLAKNTGLAAGYFLSP